MKAVLTLDETAEFLKVHPSTVYRLLKKKQIPAFKMGSDWRFNQESIERWIIEREQAVFAVVLDTTDEIGEPREQLRVRVVFVRHSGRTHINLEL